jgi:TRAP transporter TAXI family solute receptor
MRDPAATSLHRRKVLLWILVVVLMGVVFALTWWLSEPAAPKKVQLATGAEGGAYSRFGGDLKELVAKLNGPSTDLLGTQGSWENLDLLASGGADIAFVQSGVLKAWAQQDPDDPSTARDTSSFRAIARVYSEPLWVFYRGDEVRFLGDLQGRRIGIGPEGSGTKVVAEDLLDENGVTAENSTLQALPVADSILRFEQGELDVVFFVASPEAKNVQDLLRMDGAHLMDFVRHRAYARLKPHLSAIDLPPGLLSLRENLPEREIVLLGPSATLMTTEAAHPRIVELFTKAATQLFTGGNDIDLPGEYPTATGLEVLQHEAARRYMTEGESWMSRHLPYSAVRLIAKLKLLLIPLITVLLPAFKLVPVLLRFRVRHLLKKHYESLRDVEARIREAETPEELRQQLAQAEQLRDDLSKLSGRIPGTYQDNLYHWRLHINLVREEGRERLQKMEG